MCASSPKLDIIYYFLKDLKKISLPTEVQKKPEGYQNLKRVGTAMIVEFLFSFTQIFFLISAHSRCLADIYSIS